MRRAILTLMLGLAVAGPARAQTLVYAPGGTLNGMVRDSATGLPVGYALVMVVGQEQRVFASESGRFILTGLGSGGLTLRVQQIGFRAVTLTLKVDPSPESGGGAPGLEVRLSRRPVILPEIVVHGDVCTGTEALGSSAVEESIIDEALKNAERVQTLEKSYPYRFSFAITKALLSSGRQVLRRWTDTVRYDTRTLVGYRRGKVLEGSRGPGQVANYFSTADLARTEFRKSHCFWYAGRDTAQGGAPGHRIEFAPIREIRDADWAGSVVIDSATMMVARSEARLVNLVGKKTTFTSASCIVTYRQIVPTLVLESQVDCASTRSAGPAQITLEHWVMISFRFIDKSPVADSVP